MTVVRALLPESRVTSAFQNLSARDLLRPHLALEGDVAVCGDDAQARCWTVPGESTTPPPPGGR